MVEMVVCCCCVCFFGGVCCFCYLSFFRGLGFSLKVYFYFQQLLGKRVLPQL